MRFTSHLITEGQYSVGFACFFLGSILGVLFRMWWVHPPDESMTWLDWKTLLARTSITRLALTNTSPSPNEQWGQDWSCQLTQPTAMPKFRKHATRVANLLLDVAPVGFHVKLRGCKFNMSLTVGVDDHFPFCNGHTLQYINIAKEITMSPEGKLEAHPNLETNPCSSFRMVCYFQRVCNFLALDRPPWMMWVGSL